MLKRAICAKCDSPITRCLCSIVDSKFSYPFPIIVLQHPDEKNHYLNTVKILKLSIIDLKVFNAEKFNENILSENKNWFVLFPEIEIENRVNKSHAQSFDPNSDGLIIIDGSWRKAKKIYFTNSFLHSLPKLNLKNSYQSQYELRVCSRENHLSTLEAFSYMMDELEIGKEINLKLRDRMKVMVEKQKRLSQKREPIT